jgi:hypothetical protein
MECEMKNLIPIKMIVAIDPVGSAVDGVIQYQLVVDGSNNGKFYTIGIQGALDTEGAAAIKTFIDKAIAIAKQAEAIQ